VALESEVKVMRGWYTVNMRWSVVKIESGLGLISQQPCSKVGMARVRRVRLAKGQARQTKSNKVIRKTDT
jgi:hypothetical protein